MSSGGIFDPLAKSSMTGSLTPPCGFAFAKDIDHDIRIDVCGKLHAAGISFRPIMGQNDPKTPGPNKTNSDISREILGLLVHCLSTDVRCEFLLRYGALFSPNDQHVNRLGTRDMIPKQSVVSVGHIAIGGPSVVFIAGPCSVESHGQINDIAKAVHSQGAHILRGGAYKARTSPYAFQGLGEKGLELLYEAGKTHSLPIVVEVLDIRDLPAFCEKVDMIQIGARNMQNFSLLKEAGQTGLPILLKRGMGNTIDEWLWAAEYILSVGNPSVVLCERGIRSFESATRFTFDLNAIAFARSQTFLPIIADPSHGTGHWPLVKPVAAGSIAAGADGVMVEVHPNPEEALSDGRQSLTIPQFGELRECLKRVAHAIDRE